MKRDFNVPLKILTGEAIKDETTGQPLMARTVVINALMSPFDDERDLSGEAKVERYKLAQRIYAADGGVELSVEEASLVKKLVGKAYAPLVVGQVYALLEGD